MFLQFPQLAHSPCNHCSRQQPAFARVTSVRRYRSRPARIAVVDTAQVVDQDVTSSINNQPEALAKSQLNSSRADFDMNSRVQVPRNKVLTTTMIAHATNKDVIQVTCPCHHDINNERCGSNCLRMLCNMSGFGTP